MVLADINASMLQVGPDPLIHKGLTDNVLYRQVNAQATSRPPLALFDCGGHRLNGPAQLSPQ